MVYNRASASDYDAWETTYGNKGWGSDKLIPLLKKVILLHSDNFDLASTQLPFSGGDIPRRHHK